MVEVRVFMITSITNKTKEMTESSASVSLLLLLWP